MLLYIHKIEYCEAKHLTSAIFLPDHFKVILKEVMPWREVAIVGLAALETGEELDNVVLLHMQKLTATLETEYVLPQSPTFFLITAVNGMQYLIGTADAPFPLIQQNTILSSNASENAITELVVNFTSQNLSIKTQYQKI
jgi:hypothetical protein